MLPAGIARFAIVAVVSALAVLPAAAQENYESWEPLKDPFPSTGGGGIMIGGYRPVVMGDKCRTDFTATEPGGTVYYNMRRVRRRAGPGRHPVHQRQVALARRQRLGHHALSRVHQGRRVARLAVRRSGGRAVDGVRARLEGLGVLAEGAVEQAADQHLQREGFELVVDGEIDVAAACDLRNAQRFSRRLNGPLAAPGSAAASTSRLGGSSTTRLVKLSRIAM